MTILNLKGKEAPKAARSAMETMIFSRVEVDTWRIPPFQRPLRVNDKVRAMAEDLTANGGVISGVLTLGRLERERTFFIVDGQHRVEAFKISQLKECIADVRIVTFENMGEMAEEFVTLNSSLVKMRPDDILRGLEGSIPALSHIARSCDFIGYGNIRRGDAKSPVVSMSLVLKAWNSSTYDTPSNSSGSRSATQFAQDIDDLEAQRLVVFMQVARDAWGADVENYRLWGSLNLTILMWMWRRIVLDKDRSGNKRTAVLTVDQFKKCLMSVAADRSYADWLVGRNLTERDRAPCYSRLKAIMIRRLQQDSTKKLTLPQPAWGSR